MLALLGVRAATLAVAPPADDDWYLNLLWIDRRKCLLLTHAGTLFPVFVADVRKADITPIGPYVVSIAEEQLRSEGLVPTRSDCSIPRTSCLQGPRAAASWES